MTPGSAVVIGDSPGMRDAVRAAARVASTTAGVLIQGESGTGKELLARFLHERSRRWAGPFVAINCGELAEHVVESELFGWEPDLDLDGPGERVGKFEQASGGTLFLDEVGEMGPVAQARVLRVLEERAVERVGGELRVPVDVRLVAASKRELKQDVAAGRFREDLYYRLAVIVLTLPPLRERGDDVRMLAEHFVGSVACANDRPVFAIAPETLSLLQAHPWPGNVRQLKDTLERATSAAAGPLLLPADFPADTYGTAVPLARRRADGDIIPLDELERRHVQRVLGMTSGHLGHAAELLGIGRLALRRKLGAYGVH